MWRGLFVHGKEMMMFLMRRTWIFNLKTGYSKVLFAGKCLQNCSLLDKHAFCQCCCSPRTLQFYWTQGLRKALEHLPTPSSRIWERLGESSREKCRILQRKGKVQCSGYSRSKMHWGQTPWGRGHCLENLLKWPVRTKWGNPMEVFCILEGQR